MAMYNPSHPGRLIRAAMGKAITVTALAQHIGVTRAQLSMILNGRAGVSALMSLKLDEALGKSEGFYFRVQQGYDLAQALRVKRKKIKCLVHESAYEEAA